MPGNIAVFIISMAFLAFGGIVIGQSFDLWDFLYYLIGAVLAYILLRTLTGKNL